MSEPLVIARDLRKTYKLGRRPVLVLQGVTLTVNRGEFVALRGASGAGKSTLLHVIGGLDTVDQGEISVAGQPSVVNLRRSQPSSRYHWPRPCSWILAATSASE